MKTNAFLKSVSTAPISAKWRIFFAISLIIIVAGLATFFIVGGVKGDLSEGVNAGIDFQGGTILSVRLGKTEIDKNYAYHELLIRKEIEKEGVKVAIVQTRQASDEENYAIDFRYKNKTKDDAETAATNDRIRAAVAALYPDRAGNESFVNYESISATSSQQLINRALLAIGISTVLIFIYIAIRFDLMSGLAAIITMLHDALIMFAITVMTRLQVGGFFIAAVFAVLVFSLINSVVVFDRLREFKKPFKGERNLNYEELGDRAVRATFTNSVFGGLATFATVFVLALVGIVAIRDFTVQLIIGIVASVYSATFISVPLWCRLMRLSDRSYEKRMLKKNPAAAAAKAEEPASETVEEKAESTAAKKSQKNVYSNKYHKKNKKK